LLKPDPTSVRVSCNSESGTVVRGVSVVVVRSGTVVAPLDVDEVTSVPDVDEVADWVVAVESPPVDVHPTSTTASAKPQTRRRLMPSA
jgi:hypothetical protein